MLPNKETYRDFVLGLVLQMRPHHILEIGLGSCHTTAAELLHYAEEDFEKLFVIEKDPNPVALEEISSAMDDGRCELRKGDSRDPAMYEGLSDGQNTCDLVLVDGLHTAQGVYSDIQMIVNHNILTPDGVIVFHDGGASNVRLGINQAAKDFGLQVLHLPALNLSIGKYA